MRWGYPSPNQPLSVRIGLFRRMTKNNQTGFKLIKIDYAAIF